MSVPDVATPLFARYHDFMLWLTPALEKFPRGQRFLLAQRLLAVSEDGYAHLIRARKVGGSAREQALITADVRLEQLRLYLRLAQELKCLSFSQYEHAARSVDELGRLLGAWRFPKQPAAA